MSISSGTSVGVCKFKVSTWVSNLYQLTCNKSIVRNESDTNTTPDDVGELIEIKQLPDNAVLEEA